MGMLVKIYSNTNKISSPKKMHLDDPLSPISIGKLTFPSNPTISMPTPFTLTVTS
jgi:hypothetical protein